MLSTTLDTSSALNFLGMRDEEPDADLLQLLHLGMRHRVLIGVTDEAYHELETDPDEHRTRRQAERVVPFVADAIAVALGYGAHPDDSTPRPLPRAPYPRPERVVELFPAEPT